MNDGSARNIEAEFIRKDGSLLTVLFSSIAVYDAQGNYQTNRTTMLNISERKQTEIELRDSEERFRQLFEKAPIGIAMSGIDNKIFAANAAFSKMMAYPQEELLGKTVTDLTHPDYVALTHKMLSSLRGGEIPTYSIDKKYLRKDGTSFWGRAIATEIAGHEPSRRFFIGMIEDITSRIEREELRLAEVEQKRDVLIREVHHRIKNNLQGVVGLLRQHAIDHPDLAGVIKTVIGRIYAIAIIHGLQSQELTEGVSIDGLMRSIVEASGAPVDFASTLPAPVFLNREEAVPIALVLNELLTNASKHRLRRGPVTVRLDRLADDTLIAISNPFDAASINTNNGQGLNLVKSLLPRKYAHLATARTGNIYLVELRLSPPVTML